MPGEKSGGWVDGFAALRSAVAEQPAGPRREALARGVAAFEAVMSGEPCAEAALDDVVAVVRIGQESLALHGAEMLVELASRHEAALAALRSVARSKPAAERFAVLVSVDHRLPRADALAIVADGLRDKSKKVQKFARQRAIDLDAKELLPLLESLGADAAYHAAMVRDGYFAEPQRGTLTVKTPTGTTTELVAPADLDPARVAARAREILDGWEQSPMGELWRERAARRQAH